jgi:hypothetical protein
MVVVELSEAELRLLRTALHNYLDTFGHDQSDVRQQIRAVLDRLPAAKPGPVLAPGSEPRSALPPDFGAPPRGR